MQVPGQPALHSQTLSNKQPKMNFLARAIMYVSEKKNLYIASGKAFDHLLLHKALGLVCNTVNKQKPFSVNKG